MKALIFIAIVTLALALVSSNANAQVSSYAGNYYFGVVYTVGPAAGLGSHGGASISRTGQVVFTEYFPSTGQSFTATGFVTRRGLLGTAESFLAVTGQIFKSGKRRLGNGFFGNPSSGGSFFLVRN